MEKFPKPNNPAERPKDPSRFNALRLAGAFVAAMAGEGCATTAIQTAQARIEQAQQQAGETDRFLDSIEQNPASEASRVTSQAPVLAAYERAAAPAHLEALCRGAEQSFPGRTLLGGSCDIGNREDVTTAPPSLTQVLQALEMPMDPSTIRQVSLVRHTVTLNSISPNNHQEFSRNAGATSAQDLRTNLQTERTGGGTRLRVREGRVADLDSHYARLERHIAFPGSERGDGPAQEVALSQIFHAIEYVMPELPRERANFLLTNDDPSSRAFFELRAADSSATFYVRNVHARPMTPADRDFRAGAVGAVVLEMDVTILVPPGADAGNEIERGTNVLH